MLLITTLHRAARQNDRVHVDAALHAELLRYCELLGPSVAALVTEVSVDALVGSEVVELDAAAVPYELRWLQQSWEEEPSPNTEVEILGHLAGVRAVIGAQGRGLAGGVFDAAVERGLPAVVATGDATLGEVAGHAPTEPRSGPLGRVFAAARARVSRLLLDHQLDFAAAIRCRGYLALAEAERRGGQAPSLMIGSRLAKGDLLSPERCARRMETLASGRRPRLFWAGALEDSHGAPDIARWAVEMRRLGVDFRLQMFGRGGLKAEVQRILDQGGARHLVQVLPPLSWADQKVVMAQADAMLCAGRGDASLPVCIEAMGHGLPVIGLSRGALPALATDSDACWLAPDGNLRAAARGTRRLLRNPDRLRQLALLARDFARNHCVEANARRAVEAVRPWLAGAKAAQTPDAMVDLALLG